jgi:uncharacterized membrane protein
MLLFWASAAGGIALAIRWGLTRKSDPGNRQRIAESLKKRLQRGELTQEEYDRRMLELEKRTPTPPR